MTGSPFQSFHDSVAIGGLGGLPVNSTSNTARFTSLPIFAPVRCASTSFSWPRSTATATSSLVPAGTANEYSRYVSGDASVGSCSRDESSFTAGRPGSAEPTGTCAALAAGAAGAAGFAVAGAVVAAGAAVFAAGGAACAGAFDDASSALNVRPFFDAGPFVLLSALIGRGGTDFVAGEEDAGDGGSFGSVATVAAVVDVAGGAADGGLGATPPLASFASGAVMGVSSGARFTTKRTRASGSTAR